MRTFRFALMLAVVLVLAGRAPGAWACSCVRATQQQHFQRADVVFSGIATAKEDTATPGEPVSSGRVIRWTFDVQDTQKGRASDPQLVESAASEASCGYEFTIGRRYQVYGDRQDGKLRAGLCSGTHQLEGGQLAATGDPIYPLAIGLVLVLAGLHTRRASARG